MEDVPWNSRRDHLTSPVFMWSFKKYCLPANIEDLKDRKTADMPSITS